jgi:hypothetical protein
LNNQLQKLILNSENTELASPTVTTEQSQSTPAANARDDGPTQAPTRSGDGAGTTNNAATSVGADDNPGPSSNTQQIIAQSYGQATIVTQPNVLDQYASYTYAISWYLLTPEQFNAITTGGAAPAYNTGSWKLLMQSGGAPTPGRDQYFPVDYYLDDLEINTFLSGKGTNMSTNAMDIKFKVVEPNGITLTQRLFQAVTAAYKNSKQPPNYVTAQYCLIIQFYGYDSAGNLVAPATGQYSQTGQFSRTNSQAVIQKYFPFVMQNISWRAVNQAIEYHVTGHPVPYVTATSQARGTIPFPFSLSGQTVQQILQGSGKAGTTIVSTVDPGARTSTDSPAKNVTPATSAPQVATTVGDLPMQQQAAIAAGTDYNLVNEDGMAFGGGGL